MVSREACPHILVSVCIHGKVLLLQRGRALFVIPMSFPVVRAGAVYGIVCRGSDVALVKLNRYGTY